MEKYTDVGSEVVNEAHMMAISALEHQKWIPVNEILPETDEMMLVTCKSKNGNVTINRAYYWHGYWHGCGSMAGVIARKPLPESYREEE